MEDKVYCKTCDVYLNAKPNRTLQRHLQTKKHRENSEEEKKEEEEEKVVVNEELSLCEIIIMLSLVMVAATCWTFLKSLKNF